MNLSPSHLIDAFGLIGIATIIFAETGLLIGFFLPGDSLLFTAGAAAAGALPQLTFRPNIWVLLIVVVVAAIAGFSGLFVLSAHQCHGRPDRLSVATPR